MVEEVATNSRSTSSSSPPGEVRYEKKDMHTVSWSTYEEEEGAVSDSSLDSIISKIGTATADTGRSSFSSINSDFSYHFRNISAKTVTNHRHVMEQQNEEIEGYADPEEYFERAKVVQFNSPSPYANDSNDTAPTSSSSSSSSSSKPELILFGIDFTDLPPTFQFLICASCVFIFNLCYGFLQELISIQIAGRRFHFFLGSCQFLGYAFWSAVLAKLRNWRIRRNNQMSADSNSNNHHQYQLLSSEQQQQQQQQTDESAASNSARKRPPMLTYFVLAIFKATDLALSNMSHTYLNYPAKCLIKSSRVIFTMIMGIAVGKKKYSTVDYMMVFMLVSGLSMFIHADMNSNSYFHPLGVLMLVSSLILDGTVSNWSEVTMNKYNLGQDDFQMKLFCCSFILMTLAAYQNNEIEEGFQFFFQTHGTYGETQMPNQEFYSWSIQGKTLALCLFSTLGIFGGSCACAITKRFGALAMSITTTTRKAATIFLSFALFPDNPCTLEHILGVSTFVVGLFLKVGAKNEKVMRLLTSHCTSVQSRTLSKDSFKKSSLDLPSLAYYKV